MDALDDLDVVTGVVAIRDQGGIRPTWRSDDGPMSDGSGERASEVAPRIGVR